MRMSLLANCPPVAISPSGQAIAISTAARRLRHVKFQTRFRTPSPPTPMSSHVRGAIFGDIPKTMATEREKWETRE